MRNHERKLAVIWEATVDPNSWERIIEAFEIILDSAVSHSPNSFDETRSKRNDELGIAKAQVTRLRSFPKVDAGRSE